MPGEAPIRHGFDERTGIVTVLKQFGAEFVASRIFRFRSKQGKLKACRHELVPRILRRGGNCSDPFVLQVVQFWHEFDHLHSSNQLNRFRVDTEKRAIPACQIVSHETT